MGRTDPARGAAGGPVPEQYSNVFDLNSGDVFVYRFQTSDQPIKLRLADELARPAHSYDLATLQRQAVRQP